MERSEGTLVRFAGVSAAYGARTVLEGVDLTLSEGDFVTLTGPNGGGKTTLVRMILGLKKAAGGVLWHRPCLVMGYQPQYQRIDRQFPVTVREIVFSGLNCRKPFWRPFTEAQRARVDEVLTECQLDGLSGRLVSELSGGQLQRVLYARAVVSSPAEHREALYGRLRAFRHHKAVVLVTHNPAAIDYAACRVVHVDRRVTERD